MAKELACPVGYQLRLLLGRPFCPVSLHANRPTIRLEKTSLLSSLSAAGAHEEMIPGEPFTVCIFTTWHVCAVSSRYRYLLNSTY